MTANEICIELCNRALNSVTGLIPADLHNDVYDYINRFNEWGVGMELLIDRIGDLEIVITGEQFDLICTAMRAMGLDQSNRVAWLREHNISVRPK
jgi:hypothetical protein